MKHMTSSYYKRCLSHDPRKYGCTQPPDTSKGGQIESYFVHFFKRTLNINWDGETHAKDLQQID